MIKAFFIRLIKILTILLGVIFLAALLAPRLIDINKYSQNIIDKASANIGKKIIIHGKILFSISSDIKIIIPNISIQSENDKNPNLVDGGKLIVSITLYNFLTGDRNFDTLELQEATINMDNHSNNLEDILLFNSKIKIKSLIIKNATFYSQTNPNQQQYTRVNVTADFSHPELSKVIGSFYVNDEKVNIKAQVKKHSNKPPQILNFNIACKSLDLIFQQNIEIKDSSNTEGNFQIKMRNPYILVSYLAREMPFLTEAKKTSIENPVEISGYILYSASSLEAKDVKIKSTHTNGSGGFSLSLDKHHSQNIKFDFDNIDINQFLSFIKDNTVKASASEIFIDTADITNKDLNYISPDLLKKINASINITAKKILLQQVELENFNFLYDVNESNINNAILDFDIHNNDLNSKFTISNLQFDNISNTNILIGKFANQGNNINKTLELFNLNEYINIQEDKLSYGFNSKIIFSPKEISLFEIDGFLGQNSKISGSIATKQDVTTNYKVDLKFNNLKLLNFDLPLFKERLNSLTTDSRDDRYLSKFIWFRTLASTYDIKFAFENTELKGNQIDNLTVLCQILPSNMSIKGAIKSNFADGNFSLGLTSFSIMPTLDIKVEANKLDYDLLKNSLFLQATNTTQETNTNKTWDDQPMDPFGIYKYAANFDIGIKFFKTNNYTFNNFKLLARTAGDSLYIDDLEAGIYGGLFQIRGNISFFDKLLYQFSFSGSNLEAQDLLTSISPKINILKGPISIAGYVITEGNTIKDLISKLNLSSNFIGSNLNLNGIDSDAVVDLALQREKFEKEKILGALNNFLSNGTTEIVNLTGNLKITDGIIKSNNITFKTRFSNAISALYFDLNQMALSSNTQFLFLPYNDSNPLTYNIVISGNTRDDFTRKTDDANLLKYIKNKYNIVTTEDILEARKANKLIEQRKNNVIENPNDQNYLYHRIQEQNIAIKEKEEEAEVLKSLNNSNKNANNEQTDNIKK